MSGVVLDRLDRLDQLDQHAAAVLRVQKVDAAPGGPPPRLVVQHPDPPATEHPRRLLHVGHPVGELLQPRPRPFEEARDRRALVQRRQQLELGSVLRSDAEHCLPDTLLLVALLVQHLESERGPVEGERLVQVGYGDADMVDGQEELLGEVLQACAGGHLAILPQRVRVASCPDPSSSPGPAPRSAASSGPSRTSPPPSWGPSPSAALWTGLGSVATRSTTSSWDRSSRRGPGRTPRAGPVTERGSR